MGSKQTKFEDSDMHDIPTKVEEKSATLPRHFYSQRFNETHVNINQIAPSLTTPEMTSSLQTTSTTEPQNTFGLLRKRLLKGFALNDPRSPQLNRTPLIFDEVDRTLNLDDTFADLFVESRAPISETSTVVPAAISFKINKNDIGDKEIDSIASTCDSKSSDSLSAPLQQISPITPECAPLQQKSNDPRSPTYGFDRTPIIFNDEDEAHDSQMLENILETLTLNLSQDRNLDSFVSTKIDEDLEAGEVLRLKKCDMQQITSSVQNKRQQQFTNKQLDRVRLPPMKPVHRRRQQRIYEDVCENVANSFTSTPKSTPNKKDEVNLLTKRTPLGCVKNRVHLRSRSVEKNASSLKKAKLPLQSFDDQLNPLQYANMPTLHILKSAEESLDASIY